MSIISDAELMRTLQTLEALGGNRKETAEVLGISVRTVGDRLKTARDRGLEGATVGYAPIIPFRVESDIPEEINLDELLERRKKQYKRKSDHEDAKKLVHIAVNIDGPIGILHMGDPHVDDDGTDIETLEKHATYCRETEGLFAATVGDLQNNWIGRLARLYGEQSTSAAEGWALTEWLVRQCEWLYIIGGNHDAWSGAGDPLAWIARHKGTLFEGWGARLQLEFPNKKTIRINARHDFAGHSMWNPAHGIAKAVQMGWRDHILTAGHKHISGYQILKDPSSGLISHAIRVAGYKIHDRYAKEKGLPDQNISPAVITVIDPTKADNDPGLVSVFHNIDIGVDYLKWLRNRGKS